MVDGLAFPTNFAAQDERRTLVLEKDQGVILIVEDGFILDQVCLDIGDRLIAELNLEERLLSAALPRISLTILRSMSVTSQRMAISG